MKLQQELEEFLSSAAVAIVPPNHEPSIIVWFGGKQLEKFSDPYYYELLIHFFEGRRITLLVYREHPQFTFSLVDMDSGDCLNITKVPFAKGLEACFGHLQEDTRIELDIIGTSADNKYMVKPPDVLSDELMILQGYKIV